MERTFVAIPSNDKDTSMHLEIYAPEYKGDLKGLIQICQIGRASCRERVSSPV